MVHWIESQSTSVIACIVACLCYLLAAIVFGVVNALSRRPVAAHLHAISPVILTPLAVILGLLVAFLAGRVWENIARANLYIEQEVSGLSKLMLFSNSLPPEVRAKVREAVAQHVDFVVTRDWPAMAVGRANPRSDAVGLANAMAGLLSFRPTQSEQQLQQQRALASIEQAFEARRNRIALSQTEIASVQWGVIFILTLLILATIAVIHIGKPVAMASALFIFSTAISACLVLLMENDRPFSAGGITLEPTAFREIVLN